MVRQGITGRSLSKALCNGNVHSITQRVCLFCLCGLLGEKLLIQARTTLSDTIGGHIAASDSLIC